MNMSSKSILLRRRTGRIGSRAECFVTLASVGPLGVRREAIADETYGAWDSQGAENSFLENGDGPC